jgi:acetyl-CoA carboxylase carboxyltransferase component
MSHATAFSDSPPTVALDPRERIEQLCDPGSIQVLRSAAQSRRMGAGAQAGDGVLAASGAIGGRPVFCYAQDYSFAGGSLGEVHAETIVRVLSLAGRARVPVVGLIESAGARVQEATAALNGYARVFRQTVALSGRVPQVSIVSGISAGGGSYAPALTDFVVMTESANMFLTGPGVVRSALGEEVSMSELGSAAVHSRNGVCQFVVPEQYDAAVLARDLLSYLPQNVFEEPPRFPSQPPLADLAEDCVPRDTRQVYDVRDVARSIVDSGRLLEVSPRWARNLVTAFARIDGRAVGVIANQPRHKGGTIDLDASQKGASFVRSCDAFGLPLVVLVDTPGFLPGRAQEQQGIIRHGADLLRAFTAATVPRLTVILRQAYGGAYITMNSRDLGADYVFAWPHARIGIMSSVLAVGIVRRREIEAAADAQAHRLILAERYAAEHQDAHAVAQEGFIDEVIPPGETRARLCGALRTIACEHRSRTRLHEYGASA